MPEVTNLHATSGKHPACGEPTVSFEWDFGGKRKALWVNAKNGKSHFGTCPAKRPKLPDDPLVDYYIDEFRMKKAAARLMARKVPKNLPEAERMRLALQVYDKAPKGGAV